MIDEYYTWIIFGYHSDELSYGSAKRVVAVCEECGLYRAIRKDSYRDFCNSCAGKRGNRPPHSEETIRKIIEINTGRKHTDEARRKMSEKLKGRESTEEWNRKLSAWHQGIPYEEWTHFISDTPYCELFDEACRERIRAKYNNRCFLCNKHQDENITKSGKQRKLSVHHVDKNKDQGCEGIAWKLVPLCMSCHGKSHYEPMNSRIEYILANEE